MVTALDGMAFAAAQAARVGWFLAEYRLSARMARGTMPKAEGLAGGPQTADILADLRRLFARDWRNVRAGFYRLPHDLLPRPGRLLADSRRYFGDLPQVNRRRRGWRSAEVSADGAGLPDYYLQNFHFQTDGYLSDRSAGLYDHQVEVLFGGGADAMRRQLLVPIHHVLGARPAEGVRLVDVACGTGRFLSFLKDTHPMMPVTGIDLSRPYLAEAGRLLSPWRRVQLVQGAAERLPLADASADIVTCIFLFHELPREIRHRAAAEMARVLRPGGQLVFLDSLQLGDRPSYDGLLEYFPRAFFEPYYEDYIRDDLIGVFAGAGLAFAALDHVFMSKLLLFEKP